MFSTSFTVTNVIIKVVCACAWHCACECACMCAWVFVCVDCITLHVVVFWNYHAHWCTTIHTVTVTAEPHSDYIYYKIEIKEYNLNAILLKWGNFLQSWQLYVPRMDRIEIFLLLLDLEKNLSIMLMRSFSFVAVEGVWLVWSTLLLSY